MSLTKLLDVLCHATGNGHPAYFQTENGKKYQPVEVVNTRRVGEEADQIETVILLKEIK